ncbi:hypothetical protein BH23ACI1_BH23ACI1_05810 [soil metagenome]
MRGLRPFLVLLVILIGLGAYLYVVESERTPGAADDRENVFTLEADGIDEITIRSESREQTTLRRSGDDWQVVEPVTAPADPGEVSGLTSSLASLQIQRVLDEDVADFAEYGLDDPRIEVRFRSNGQDRRLSIGGKTPPGSDVYARIDDESRVVLIASYLDSTFNRGTFDLRDKALVRVEREAVDSIDITAAGRTTQLVRTDGEWRLAAPLSAPADYGEVSGLVSRLMSAQMRSTEDTPGELRTYGLDRPAATVRAAGGESPVVLALGSASATDQTIVYATLEGRPDVFTVDASLLEALRRDPAEYRQKDLFDARAFNTSRIEVTRAGETTAFEKTRMKDPEGKDEERWRQVAPAEADADGGKVDSLIFAATGTRADSFVTDARQKAPATPEFLIVIKFDDGKREDRVSFWRSGDEAFASRADAPGIARISPATLDDITRALEELP